MLRYFEASAPFHRLFQVGLAEDDEGVFPPSSRASLFSVPEQAAIRRLPVSVEPVKDSRCRVPDDYVVFQ